MSGLGAAFASRPRWFLRGHGQQQVSALPKGVGEAAGEWHRLRTTLRRLLISWLFQLGSEVVTRDRNSVEIHYTAEGKVHLCCEGHDFQHQQ